MNGTGPSEKKRKKIKIFLAGIVLVLISAGIWWVFAGQGQGELQVPVYQTEKIVRGDLETLVSSTGTTAAVGTVEVGTQVSGTISKVFADYNDKVKKGQVLAVLDLALFQSAVSENEANVMEARARLRKAELECTRNRPLVAQGHLSAQEWLSLETDRDLASAAVLSAQASLKKAKTNLENARIRSPIDGTVITRDIEEGQTVAASYSTPTLFVIAENLSRVEIEANVDESDIGQIRVGQEARFTVQAYPDDVFTGKVTQIRLKPTTISNVVTYTVVVDAENERGHLLPGMTATVDFIVARAENVLLVSSGALRFKPDNGELNGDAGRGDVRGQGSEKQGKREHVPRIFTLDAQGKPVMVRVRPGISDGNQTVLMEDGKVTEGMVVIKGSVAEKGPQKTNIFSKLAPSRPGGRGRNPARAMR